MKTLSREINYVGAVYEDGTVRLEEVLPTSAADRGEEISEEGLSCIYLHATSLGNAMLTAAIILINRESTS